MSVDFGVMFIGLWTRRYIEQTPKGGFVGTVICEKPPALASLAMAADKHQKVAALCQSLGFINICETPLVRRRVLSFK
jgi:hypothetical protein